MVRYLVYRGKWFLWRTVIPALAFLSVIQAEAAPEMVLVADGQSRLDIVIGAEADEDIRDAARELAAYLERISGAEFSVTEGDGSQGIVLGVPDDFAELPFQVPFGSGSFDRDDYLLRSTDRGLYLLGATPLSAQFALWDLLYRFGHRQFFPTDTWEIIPEQPELKMAVDDYQRPDYYNRSGPRGSSRRHTKPWVQAVWPRWRLRNRTTANFTLSTGHAYGRIIRANQQAFDENPEYWGLINGERTDRAQPNVSHPDVQRMFIDYALNHFERNPEADSVALDPRDGNPWSECEPSRAIGRPSEQAVFIANKVAEAVVERFGPDKYVGIYAYSHHSPPPEIDVHPNVIVSLATSFIRGGHTIDTMLEGWGARTELLGIREYYSLTVWHWQLAGGPRASNTEYLRRTTPKFHAHGARFMNAESTDDWGACGLGFYLAARMLWDVDEADRMEELIEDFLEKSFGPAIEPMREFYRLIDGATRDPHVPARSLPMNDDRVGRMYRQLAAARELAMDRPDVVARIDELIFYTHYVERYRAFSATRGPERQQAMDDLVRYAWRIRETLMIDSVALVTTLDRIVRRDDHLEWGEGRTRTRPPTAQRDEESFETEKILDLLESGIATHDLLDIDYDPADYDDDLLPGGFEPAERRGQLGRRANRSPLYLYLWTEDGRLPRFEFSAGQLYQTRGPVRWDLYDRNGDGVDEGDIPPDRETHGVDLTVGEPGLYRMEVSNTGQGFLWDYDPRGANVSIRADDAHPLGRNWYDRLYFYVPAGTEEILIAGTLREGRHAFLDGDGQRIAPETIVVDQGFTTVPVPDSQDGRVWSVTLRSLRAGIRFLNIPGYVALAPDELLLPRSIVSREL